MIYLSHGAALEPTTLQPETLHEGDSRFPAPHGFSNKVKRLIYYLAATQPMILPVTHNCR